MTPAEQREQDARYYAIMHILANQPLPLQLALSVGLWGRICGERDVLRAELTEPHRTEVEVEWVTRMVPVADFFLDQMRGLLHAQDYRAALQAFDAAIGQKLAEVRAMREVDRR